jgi:hypothetical protein
MAVSDRPWSMFSESDYPTAADYCRASLIDENPAGGQKTKAMCHLPVREPNGGPLNRNGVHAAAQRLGMTGVSPAAKAKAARALIQIYGDLKEDPPESVRRMARG